jgi:putative ABC transport system permease protein
MLRSYLIIAVRNFRNGRIYSLINLMGLAIGLASVMLIIGYIGYELSFDKHFAKSARIYQLILENRETDPMQQTVSVPKPLGETLIREFPEIEASTLLSPSESNFLRENTPIKLNTLLVSPNFLDIFDMPVIKGDKVTALKEKFSIVITLQTAEKLFPKEDPIGQALSQKSGTGELTYFTITGVIQNIPSNTHFKADAIVSVPGFSEELNFKGYSAIPQFVLFKPAMSPASIEDKVSKVLKKYNLNDHSNVLFLPLEDIHLRSGNIAKWNLNVGDIRYIYILGSVAFLILFIGCINYINLTTAQALRRIKEVGIRKTLGSARRQLAFQFIGESLLFFSIAALLAALIALLVWPVFGNIVQVSLSWKNLFSLSNVAIFLFVAVFSGIAAGSYPALFLSKMNPAGILKDRQGGAKFNFGFRKVLIVFQFSISIVLIITTIIVWQQLDLFKNRPIGFEKDHLLVLPEIDMNKSQTAFKQTLQDNPNILSTSVASMKLGAGSFSSSSMTDPADSRRRIDFAYLGGDFDFIETLGIKVKAGRNFSNQDFRDITKLDSLYTDAMSQKKDARADEYAGQSPIIVTERMVKTLKLKNPVNQVLKLPALQGKIIGVVKDFQITSLKEHGPLLVYQLKTDGSYATTYIRLNNRNIPQSIEYIEKTWKKFFPNHPFSYSFADDNLQKLYESESRLASIFSTFAVLAIGISTLGLFSFVSLHVKQRTKEIGIRKVMGASASGLTILLSKDFVKLIAISVVIASPIAWYGANVWLKDFANRVEIEWWVFIIAATLSLLTGILTVYLQTAQAAKMSPVDSLKTD